jgi:hypothetical protein
MTVATNLPGANAPPALFPPGDEIVGKEGKVEGGVAPDGDEAKRLKELTGGKRKDRKDGANPEVVAVEAKRAGVMNGILEMHTDDDIATGAGEERVYESVLISKVKRNAKTDKANIAIEHKIVGLKNALAPLPGSVRFAGDRMVGCKFELSSSLFEEVKSVMTKANGRLEFGKFDRECDYGAAIEVLVGALSRFSNGIPVSWDYVLGGSDRIFNRDSVKGRMEVPKDAVYVPYPAESGRALSSWFGVVAGVLGAGSVVLTDGAPEDIDGNVRLSVPDGVAFAEMLVCGLAELLHVLEECKAAAYGVYSAARGWHNEWRVCGQTAEGSKLREVYAYGSAVSPYGIVPVSGKTCNAWAVPGVVTCRSVMQWLDGMGLYTAAAFNAADPCEEVDGVWYPTVISAGSLQPDMEEAADPDEEEAARMVTEMDKRMVISAPKWSANVAEVLDIAGGSGSSKDVRDTVAMNIRKGYVRCAAAVARARIGRCVTAFIWCEAQNIMGTEVEHMQAAKSGLLYYVPRDVSGKKVPMFEEGSREVGKSSTHKGQMHINLSCARKNLGLSHLRCSTVGGLEFIIPRQMREDTVVLHGSYEGHEGDFRTRSRANDNLDDYLWAHPGTELVCTAELLVYSPGMLAEVFYTTDASRHTRESLFVGDVEEILDTSTVSPTQPRVVEITDEQVTYSEDICRNNSVALVRTLNAYGMSQHERACVLAVCSDFAYGFDMQAEDYKMDEPLRLVIEESIRSESEDDMMERFSKAKQRIKDGIDPSNDVYSCGNFNERHYNVVSKAGCFKDVLDEEGEMVRVVGDQVDDEISDAQVWSWLKPWFEKLHQDGHSSETAAAMKPKVDMPKGFVAPDNPVISVEVEKKVVDEDGKKQSVTVSEPALDRKRFDPSRVPELLGTMKFKEIGAFLFGFRKLLCEETGANDVLFRKLGAILTGNGECLLPNGLEDGGVLSLIALMTTNMTYDDVLTLLSEFVASAYLDALPDPVDQDVGGGVEETKDNVDDEGSSPGSVGSLEADGLS